MDNYRDVIHSTNSDSSDASSAEHSDDAGYSDDEDCNYDVSDEDQSSDDEDVADNYDGSEAIESEEPNQEVPVGEHMVRINSLTAEEIRGLEFGNCDEAYEFYYQYGKCKGFAIRRSDMRRKPKGTGMIVMNQFVCNKRGLRDVTNV
jgi:hypothetical protein